MFFLSKHNSKRNRCLYKPCKVGLLLIVFGDNATPAFLHLSPSLAYIFLRQRMDVNAKENSAILIFLFFLSMMKASWNTLSSSDTTGIIPTRVRSFATTPLCIPYNPGIPKSGYRNWNGRFRSKMNGVISIVNLPQNQYPSDVFCLLFRPNSMFSGMHAARSRKRAE